MKWRVPMKDRVRDAIINNSLYLQCKDDVSAEELVDQICSLIKEWLRRLEVFKGYHDEIYILKYDIDNIIKEL